MQEICHKQVNYIGFGGTDNARVLKDEPIIFVHVSVNCRWIGKKVREIDAKKEKEIEMVSGGKPFKQWTTRLFDAFDPDKRIDLAKP